MFNLITQPVTVNVAHDLVAPVLASSEEVTGELEEDGSAWLKEDATPVYQEG